MLPKLITSPALVNSLSLIYHIDVKQSTNVLRQALGNFKSNNNVVYSCKYHHYFCPKYRRKVLVNAIASRLKELLAQIAIEIEVEILEMEIMPDHVHMLIEVDPQFGVHRAVKRFKGATSRYLRLEFPELKTRLPSLWTNSYFVSTVGGAPLETIKMYIQNQKET